MYWKLDVGHVQEAALRRIIAALVLSCIAALAQAAELKRIVVSSPGPHNISYLPIDLIPAIGADKAEGAKLEILHTGGGAVALKNMVTKNADFAVAGTPAAMSLKANGGDVVVIAPVNDRPLFVLMVRAALKGKVKRIADLKGRTIGVNTGTSSSKTTSQQLAELLLRSDGLDIDQVRIVPAGQSWDEQSALMLSGMADAIVGDEPFASRLKEAGHVFFLAHLGEPGTVKGVPGLNFLHAALETRSDVIARESAKVEQMVRILKRSLAWIAGHTPEQLADVLGLKAGEERTALIQSLRKYPRSYSSDGRFNPAQLRDTNAFFQAGLPANDPARDLRIESMTDDRWAGHRP